MYLFYIQGRLFDLALSFSDCICRALIGNIKLSPGERSSFSVIGPHACEKRRLSDAELRLSKFSPRQVLKKPLGVVSDPLYTSARYCSSGIWDLGSGKMIDVRREPRLTSESITVSPLD